MDDLTVKDIRRNFLNDSEGALAEIRARMLGTQSPYPASDGKFLQEYWKAIVPMIQASSDMEKLNAHSVDSVITMLAEGKIDPDVALKLMDLLKVKQDIEELPKLREAIENLNK